MVSASDIFILAMLNSSVDITFGSQTCVSSPSIRTDSGAPFDLLGDKWYQLWCLNCIDYLCPDMATARQDPKDRLFSGTSAALAYLLLFLVLLSLVFPLTTKISFINFNCT